jgi:homocitrate synthase NifV
VRLVDVTLGSLRRSGCAVEPEDAGLWRSLAHEFGADVVEDEETDKESAACAAKAGVVPVFVKSAANFAPEKMLNSACSRPLRLCGLDDLLLLENRRGLFSRLRRLGENLPLEMAFGNSLSCATALGVTWLLEGGECLVCSFTGLSSLAALEEVIMALRLSGAKQFPGLPRLPVLREFFERLASPLAGQGFPVVPPAKAVAGRAIFAVESGIHVDGLGKDTALYEPFSPEVVGVRRRIIPGAHSGAAAIRLYCESLGLPCEAGWIPDMLSAVRCLSRKLERSLREEEFRFLHKSVCGKERYATVACD